MIKEQRCDCLGHIKCHTHSFKEYRDPYTKTSIRLEFCDIDNKLYHPRAEIAYWEEYAAVAKSRSIMGFIFAGICFSAYIISKIY